MQKKYTIVTAFQIPNCNLAIRKLFSNVLKFDHGQESLKKID